MAEDMKAACGYCLLWRANKQREVPIEPPTHFRFLGLSLERDAVSIEVEGVLRGRIIAHNDSGDCHFYPQAVETRRRHFCAQFTPVSADSPDTHGHRQGRGL